MFATSYASLCFKNPNYVSELKWGYSQLSDYFYKSV